MEISATVSLLTALINFFMIYILLGAIPVEASKKIRILISFLSAILTMVFFFILTIISAQLSLIPSNL